MTVIESISISSFDSRSAVGLVDNGRYLDRPIECAPMPDSGGSICVSKPKRRVRFAHGQTA
jgi:hypothetical protein